MNIYTPCPMCGAHTCTLVTR
ncbi:hypothetical protein KIPB_014890, partial [Kipferlia bialata]|eukprot:g14890.t1